MTSTPGPTGSLPFQHVLRAVRAEIAPDADGPDALDLPALTSQADRQEFVRLSVSHGVGPLVLAGLRRRPTELPEPLTRTLHRAVMRRSFLSMALRTETGRLAGLLHEAALPFLVLKGIAVHDAYGELSLRPSSDNDILVRPEDFGALERLLVEAGYVRKRRRPTQKKAYLLIHGQYTFERRHGEHTLFVDAHNRVMPFGYRYSEGVPDLLQRSRTLQVDGVPVPAPSWEDMVVILCTNGLKDLWTRLRLVTDLVVVSAQVNDWNAVAALAERANCREQVALGLSLAADLFGTPIPAPFASRSDSVVQLSRALAGTLRGLEDAQSMSGRVRLFLSAQDGTLSRLRYVLYTGLRRAMEPLLQSDGAMTAELS